MKSKKDVIGHHKKQRALFILSEPFTHIYNTNRADKLLRISRAICRYRFFKGNCGTVYQALIKEVEILVKNESKIEEIEDQLIRTARDFIDTERTMLHQSKGINESTVRILNHVNLTFDRVI
jgi:hypothetical protein